MPGLLGQWAQGGLGWQNLAKSSRLQLVGLAPRALPL